MSSTRLQELRLIFCVVVEDLHEKSCVAKYLMRLHEIQPNHPSTITTRHDKWLRDLIARTQASAAEREREAAHITEAQPKTIKPTKPLTPDQQRVASLKTLAKRAGQAVQAERARQQQRKAQQTLATVQKTIAGV